MQTHPVDDIKNFKLDKLIHITSLVNELPAYFERYESINGYVPINGQVLQSKIHNYKEYFNYLIHAGVLECDNHYVVGEKSKGYRFTSEYISEVQTEEISYPPLVSKIKKQSTANPPAAKTGKPSTSSWEKGLSPTKLRLCRRMHSCPSENDSYVCGDRGYCSLCQNNNFCQGGKAKSGG